MQLWITILQARQTCSVSLLVMPYGCTVKLVQLMMRARGRSNGGTGSRAVASFSASMMAQSSVDATFAPPVKIPEVALRVEHLDQIKALGGCMGSLNQVTIHGFLLCLFKTSYPEPDFGTTSGAIFRSRSQAENVGPAPKILRHRGAQ